MQYTRPSKLVELSDSEDECFDTKDFDQAISQIPDEVFQGFSTPHKDRNTRVERSESPTPAQGTKGRGSTIPPGVTVRQSRHGSGRKSDKPIRIPAPQLVPTPPKPPLVENKPTPPPLGKSLSFKALSQISSAFQDTSPVQSASSSHRASTSKPKPIKAAEVPEYVIPDSDDDAEQTTDVETDVQTPTSSSRSASLSSGVSTPFTSPLLDASASNPFNFTPPKGDKGKGVDRGTHNGPTPKQPRFGDSSISDPFNPFSISQVAKPNHSAKPSATGASSSATAATLSSKNRTRDSTASPRIAAQSPRPNLAVNPRITPRATRSAPATGPAVAAPDPKRTPPRPPQPLAPAQPNPVDALEVAVSKAKVSEDLLASSPNDESIIRRFLNLPLTSFLEPHLIAHDAAAQTALDNAKVEWGVQWELARGVVKGLWTWNEVRGKARELSGSNAHAAGRVAAIMGKATVSSTAHEVWTELDREEKATREVPERRLGLQGTFEKDANWYGGRIQQVIRLAKVDGKLGDYKIMMEPMERRRSHRFARYMGSRSMLQLRISDKAFMNEKEKVVKFLTKKFVLLGRVFVPFHSKDGSVYMVETDEDYERRPQAWCADGRRVSFNQFMEWHNPLLFNSRQAISKYVTRFALGLSNSVPVLEFKAEHIFFIDDIYASDWPVGKRGAPAEKIMTDGCGFMNLAALQAITKVMDYEYLPTAVQGRVDGAKGLWIRHPYDESDEPRIWIRASQNKIKNHELDRAHRIFELLTPSKPSIGDALSQQSIVNLWFNGVSAETLVKLFEEGLREQVQALLEWDNLVLLYHAVNKAGGVASGRMARLATTMSRALGLERQQWGNDEVDATEGGGNAGQADVGPATYTGRNPYSGAPLALYEKIMEWLQAGFTPQDFKPLQQDIKKAIDIMFSTAIEKYRIPMNDSLMAFVIPDPYAVSPLSHPGGSAIVDPTGALESRQIYFRSSVPMKDPKTNMPYHVVTGEVVVGRYPIRLPSDMQRVTAVDVPELSGWTDVVIISAKGDRSLANMLSGGDMDGDTVHILREPEVVQQFRTDNPLVEEPKDLMQEFEKEVESVAAFCERMLKLSPKDAAIAYQDVLLSNVKASNVGLYSMFHEQAVDKYSYDDPRAIRVAYIFNTLLDASKSGLRLRKGVFEKDQREFGSKPPPCQVLAQLRQAGQTLLDEFHQQLAICAEKGSSDKKDPILLAPYNRIASYIRHLSDEGSPALKLFNTEWQALKDHVKRAKDMFDKAAGQNQSTNESPSKANPKTRGGKVKADQEDVMLEAARFYSQDAPETMLITNAEEVMASYAYALTCSAEGRFPWSVAFATLCKIKAKATSKNGQFASVLYQFDECKSISSAAVRVYAKSAEQEVF